MKLPFAHIWMEDPNALCAVGPASSVGLLHVNEFLIDDDTAEHRAWLRNWNQQWKRWKRPYNTPLYTWPSGTIGAGLSEMYWFLDVLQRAGSTDPEKIIKVWEGDEYRPITGAIYQMRACDHQAIIEMYATEFVHPNKWFESCAYTGKIIKIPAKYVTPPVPEDLERCKK